MGGFAGAAVKSFKVACGFKIVQAVPPGTLAANPATPKGDQFGLSNCQAPFGKGVIADSFAVTPSTPTTGAVGGPFKLFFNTGTVRGLYKLNYTVTPPATTTFKGTLSVGGGTGRFRGSKGHGSLACSSPDGGVHLSCTAKFVFSRI
jgi:hypothetical protein